MDSYGRGRARLVQEEMINYRNKTVIEIIGIGRSAVYSIGKIHIANKGDVYLISKIHNAGIHLSRHVSGKCHVGDKKGQLFNITEKKISIARYDECEFLQTWAIGLDSLPELFREHKWKKCNGVVAIDMRNYERRCFNLGIALLNEKSILQFISTWKNFEDRQLYIYAESNPMIGIVFGAYNKQREDASINTKQ